MMELVVYHLYAKTGSFSPLMCTLSLYEGYGHFTSAWESRKTVHTQSKYNFEELENIVI